MTDMASLLAPPSAPPVPDKIWLIQLLNGESQPTLPPEARLRLQRVMRAMRLEELLPMLERVAGDQARPLRIDIYQAWIAANLASPQLCAAWFNLGVELANARDWAGAMQAYEQALALKPTLHQAAINLGLAQENLGHPELALATWEQAQQPDEVRQILLNQRGRALENLHRYEEAELALRSSLQTNPQQPDVIQHWGHIRQKACMWPVTNESVPALPAESLDLHIGPLGSLALTDDIVQQRRAVEAWLERKLHPTGQRLSPVQGYRHERIRIGYMSSDFCRHALSFLLVETLERHDRSQFEIFGYCSSPEDNSDIRRRVIQALDHHVPVGHLSDEQLAQRIRQDEIDILVDLNGLTKGARLQTLRWKPAPVQASYLGYVGPVPVPELDYLICDDYVIPPALADLYAPRPLPLQGLYQANDSKPVEVPTLSRQDEGLPDDRFVFCCFSNHYKITEAMFGAWLSILERVPASVLWLVGDSAISHRNLQQRLAQRHLAPERLIFAGRVDPARYMARFRLADLFLDTFPYNAGTVASDALRMGLPLVTLSGRAFASRMAGSLLHAVGLDEAVAATPEAYIECAVRLATDRQAHARLRAVLADGAWARSIGDCAGFTRRLEAAYRSICLAPPRGQDIA